MKAIELRLKNYVFDTGVLAIVTCIEEDRLSTNRGKLPYSFYDEIEPVPLTEEWLLKFGFKKRIEFGMVVCDSWQGLNYWFINNKDCFTLRGDPIYGLSYQGGIKPYPEKNIKFVHQLQNLYFDLTGNELEIK